MRLPQLAFLLATALGLAACEGDKGPAAPTATPSQAVVSRTATIPPTRLSSSTPAPTATPVAPTPAPADVPQGFPLDPALVTDLVEGPPGSRFVAPLAGTSVRDVATRVQLLADPVAANASGWNCAVHVEYEGTPAIDWYIREASAVYATMDGTATLFVNTFANAFEYYGIDREPYLGNPDRVRAPLAPFPGPGGGMGVYVSVTSATYRTDYGHLSLAPTLAVVPDGAFADAFSRSYDYGPAYGVPRDFRVADIIASWEVRRGDVIGYTGDAGYSEAPHLHYQVTRRSDGARLCPGDSGW